VVVGIRCNSIDTTSLLGGGRFGRRGTNPAACLTRLGGKHDLSGTAFPVDQFGYRTEVYRIGSISRVDYVDRDTTDE
jgi:hypothetical protein